MAVIATDCPSGPGDIIRNGIDGLLVPKEDGVALANAMDRLMSDARERQRLAKKSAEVLDRFQLSKILQMWEATLSQVIA